MLNKVLFPEGSVNFVHFRHYSLANRFVEIDDKAIQTRLIGLHTLFLEQLA